MATPNQDYSFIVNAAQPKPKSGLPPLNFRNVMILGLGILLVFTLIILLAGRSKPQPTMAGAAARAHELARVSDLVAQKSTDPSLQSLATTVSVSMNSEQNDIVSYLSSNHVNLGSISLSADQNSATDSQISAAIQNNNLKAVYSGFLKTNLGKYLSDLMAASNNAGPRARTIISSAKSSAQIILSSPSLKP